MPGLDPGIHVFLAAEAKTWMTGTSLDKPGHDGDELGDDALCDLLCDRPTGKSLLIFRNRVKPRNQKYSASR